MRMDQVREIANAVLYEGYLLYPYRLSAIKNRRRWTFGVVYPREYSEAGGGIEPCMMQTECLVKGKADTSLDIMVRFLHLLVRSSAGTDVSRPSSSFISQPIDESWEEGIEREVAIPPLSLGELVAHPQQVKIEFAAERITDAPTSVSATEMVREQRSIEGAIIITAEQAGSDLFKVRVQIENTTPETHPDILERTALGRRDTVLLQSFVSTHTVLQVSHGSFISLLDFPEEVQSIVKGCQNLHTWPVLIGKEGDHDTLLSSPIILYDYPQIAPESPGALFDGTEIDEILTLRIMTLTDEEKEEMRQDQRTREILERTEALSPEEFMKMHGTIRTMQPVSEEASGSSAGSDYPGEDYPPPASVLIAGRRVKAGDSVRLHPKRRADIFDILLEGKTARVEAVQQDFENRIYLVVTVDDDPGREQWDERTLPGHRFYFFPEEVEPLGDSENTLPGSVDRPWSIS